MTVVVIATTQFIAYPLHRVRARGRRRLPTWTNPLRCHHRARTPPLRARRVDQSLQAVSPD